VKKSIVITSAISSVSLNTAASSAVVEPTSNRSSVHCGRPRTIGSSAAAGSLQPQPAPCASAVSATAGAVCGALMAVPSGPAADGRRSTRLLRSYALLDPRHLEPGRPPSNHSSPWPAIVETSGP
jgi:hypothetical protein